MATKEEARQALLEKMGDPTLSSDAFDELSRRVELLTEE